MPQSKPAYSVVLKPPSGARRQVPLALRVVELSNHAAIVTILFGSAGTGRKERPGKLKTGWRTVVYQISPAGKVGLWKPGKDYPAGAIWHADANDHLYGFDSLEPEWIYVCRASGSHIATLLLPMRLGTPISPALFAVRGKLVGFAAPDGALGVASFEELRQAAKAVRKSNQSAHGKSKLAGWAGRPLALEYTVKQIPRTRHTYQLRRQGKGLVLVRR
jgi:hypothetical protein